MANNKAFVRYANNKAVPGSLIVRKKAPSVGVWKEVNYDLCCNNNNCVTPLSDITVTTNVNIPEEGVQGAVSIIISNGTDCFSNAIYSPIIINITTYDQFVNFLNTNFSYIGLFSYTAPDIISLKLSSNVATGQVIENCSPLAWALDITFI